MLHPCGTCPPECRERMKRKRESGYYYPVFNCALYKEEKDKLIRADKLQRQGKEVVHMSTDDRILAILERMDQRLEHLETDISGLTVGQAKLQEDVTEIKTDIKYLWEDVQRIENKVGAHETILQAKIM